MQEITSKFAFVIAKTESQNASFAKLTGAGISIIEAVAVH
jgi:hypothetical protein